MNTVIDHDETGKIEQLLLGRKVVKADVRMDTLTLDDGTTVRVRANEGCGGCSNGAYWVSDLNTCDNIITKVEQVIEDVKDSRGYQNTVYRVFVYAEDRRINLIDVEGDDGNGYYGTGFQLIIEGPA